LAPIGMSTLCRKTHFDYRVSLLCFAIEDVFLYLLKTKLKQDVSLRHVSLVNY